MSTLGRKAAKFPFPPLPSARKPILLQACRNQAVINLVIPRGCFSADRALCATPQAASWKEKWADARDASPKWGRRTTQTLTAYRGSYGRCKQANRLG